MKVLNVLFNSVVSEISKKSMKRCETHLKSINFVNVFSSTLEVKRQMSGLSPIGFNTIIQYH